MAFPAHTPLNVLHLSSEKSWRGGEQQIAYLIDELTALGVNNVVAARQGSVFHHYALNKNLPLFPLPFRNSMDIRTALDIKRICRSNKIHIVHMHSASSHGIAVLSAVLGNPTPLVLSRRVDFVPKRSWFTRWKYNHPSIKRILCVSDKIREIMEAYTAHPEKCVTVHSGIDMKKFSGKPTASPLVAEFGLDTHIHLVGNTSALEDHKDYPTFIAVIERLVQRNVPVQAFIIGKGGLEESLRGLVRAKHLEHVIHFTGFRSDIAQVLPGLSVFLMTSKEEGLGTSILDAFLAGVPVVATRAGGIPEMVIDGQTGLLAAPGDADALAAAVEKVLIDTSLRARLVAGAHAKVQEFSKEETARKTLVQYLEVLRAD